MAALRQAESFSGPLITMRPLFSCCANAVAVCILCVAETATPKNVMSRPLLTYDQVAQWRHRLDEIAKVEERLKGEREDIERKLDAVAILVGDVPSIDAETDSKSDAQIAIVVERSGKPTWSSEIVRIMDECGHRLSYDDLREKINDGALKGEFEKSDKGFYHAISRLQDRGYLKKYRGWLFRTDDLKRHKKSVNAGDIKDVPDISHARRSPMAEEVKSFLWKNPTGCRSGQILTHLTNDDRFRETLIKNPTGAYNVISRLVRRDEIRKEGQIYYPLKGNEAAVEASEADAEDTVHVSSASISKPSTGSA